MTSHQVFIVACIGGLAAVLGLAAIVLLALGVYAAVQRVIDARDAFLIRRQDLKDCRAIAALGTTRPDRPKH